MPSSVGVSSAEERGIALLIIDPMQGLTGKDFPSWTGSCQYDVGVQSGPDNLVVDV